MRREGITDLSFRQCWPSSKDFGRTTWCAINSPGGPGLGLRVDGQKYPPMSEFDVYYDVGLMSIVFCSIYIYIYVYMHNHFYVFFVFFK